MPHSLRISPVSGPPDVDVADGLQLLRLPLGCREGGESVPWRRDSGAVGEGCSQPPAHFCIGTVLLRPPPLA